VNKKPLIVVSILAVVLLVLGSLSNVVGYQSVKSATVSDSPLFTTRTQRATNQQQNTYTFQYLGKGKNNNLVIPPRLDETDSFRVVISRIRAMDESIFNRFVWNVVHYLGQQEKIKEGGVNEIKIGFQQIRMGGETLIVDKSKNDGNATWKNTRTLCWFPGCIMLGAFQLILDALALIILLLWFISPPPVTIYPPTFNECYCIE
jgi:hypothetical protein